ncbi:sodium:neurotransmitter symporter superfamily [Holotrichia oblita]|uniref:Sodium:neurotransmitter symporter superfamily n=1 Tax=Holotrichia oblita TaxID=644536 RepID=A0ACB9TT85_HOLOL|nr:sodium:neurotransmitter symporter superfamily [Holotrichia oblita]
MSCLQPKATRDGNKLRKRLQNEAQKAYDKHKLAEEQLEAEKLKLLSKAAKDESSDQDDKTIFDSRGLYFVDLETIDATNGEESDSIFSSNSVYFKNTFFNKFYKTFLSTEKKLRLSWAEYMCFTFLLHVPLVYIYRHIFLVGAFGAGLAYSIAIQGLFLEIFNVILAAIALYYAILMFSKSIPWKDCSFEYSSDTCMVADPDESYNKTCCHPFRSNNCTIENNVNLSRFSSYDYFNNYVMRIGNKTAPIQTGYLAHLVINAEIIWFVIFILVAIGLRRCAKIFSIINMTMYITLVPIMLYTFAISSRYTIVDYITSDFSSLKDYRVSISILEYKNVKMLSYTFKFALQNSQHYMINSTMPNKSEGIL